MDLRCFLRKRLGMALFLQLRLRLDALLLVQVAVRRVGLGLEAEARDDRTKTCPHDSQDKR